MADNSPAPELAVVTTAQPSGCAAIVEDDASAPVLQTGAAAPSAAAAARYYRERGSLDEDRGFGSARQLLSMVGERRQLTVSGPADQVDLDLTIDFVHHPLAVSGQRWSSFWVLESTPPGVTPRLAVPICFVVRSADGHIAQQWNDALLTSDEPGRAVITATAFLATPRFFQAPVGQTCTTVDVELDMRGEETRAWVYVTTNAFQACAAWMTNSRPAISSEGLPAPEWP